MGVVPRVAATTYRRCLAVLHRVLVAALAGRSDVGIVECEVGEIVSKLDLAESRDIGIAAQVLGVTSTALAVGGLPHATVITAFGADILGDLFVTGQALRALPRTVGEVVTVRAFGLDPGVCLGDRAGHNELLDAGRPDA